MSHNQTQTSTQDDLQVLIQLLTQSGSGQSPTQVGISLQDIEGHPKPLVLESPTPISTSTLPSFTQSPQVPHPYDTLSHSHQRFSTFPPMDSGLEGHEDQLPPFIPSQSLQSPDPSTTDDQFNSDGTSPAPVVKNSSKLAGLNPVETGEEIDSSEGSRKRKTKKTKAKNHICPDCGKAYDTAGHLTRHRRTHAPPQLACPIEGCQARFHRKDNMLSHYKNHLKNLDNESWNIRTNLRETEDGIVSKSSSWTNPRRKSPKARTVERQRSNSAPLAALPSLDQSLLMPASLPSTSRDTSVSSFQAVSSFSGSALSAGSFLTNDSGYFQFPLDPASFTGFSDDLARAEVMQKYFQPPPSS